MDLALVSCATCSSINSKKQAHFDDHDANAINTRRLHKKRAGRVRPARMIG